jgi:hypothetical protein
MQIVAEVATAMQAVFGEMLNGLARATGCVQRERKFCGVSLLRTLVLTLLQHPAATRSTPLGRHPGPVEGEKERDDRREPSRTYWALPAWTIFITDCPPEPLDMPPSLMPPGDLLDTGRGREYLGALGIPAITILPKESS